MQTLNLSYCRKLISAVVVMLLLYTAVTGQTTSPYCPLKDDSIAYVQLVKEVTQRYKSDVAALTGSNKKYIAEIYEGRVDHVKRMTDHKELITDKDIQQYLQSITALIINANPQLASLNTRFYFSRSAVPNAFSMGDGTIIFNIGLFTRLENEAQLAFILCHELAHLYLNHSNKGVDKYISTLYAKETQHELRKIKNAEYQQNARLEALAKQFSFNTSRHSRDHESEADSMGVVFLKNTRFATTAAISGLAILDTIDVETFDTNAFLKQTFNWKDYPFKNRWIEKEEGLLGGHATLATDKKLDDSLKTHPDCQDRIKAITPLVTATTNAGQQNFLISAQQFAQLKKNFSYEIVEHYFVSNNLSACLYFSAQLLKNNHNDPYLIATMGKLMGGLYIAQKNHRLSSCTQQPAPHNSSNYNNLLQFLQNLYLEEIASINYYFLQQYEQQLISYEDFVFALTVSKQQNNKPQEQAYWKDFYNKSFTPKKYSLN